MGADVSVVHVVSVAITQVDVLYVSQQIKRDLNALRDCYPGLLSDRWINDLDIAVGTFLFNDAISSLGFSVIDPADDDLVYHELRYVIEYSGEGSRTGMGGRSLAPVQIPRRVALTPWVVWSQSMLSLPFDKQRLIVQGTGWGAPGSDLFRGRYRNDDFLFHATYASGPLAAQAQEYRNR